MDVDKEQSVFRLSQREAELLNMPDVFPFEKAGKLYDRIVQARQSIADNPPTALSPVNSERQSAIQAHHTAILLLESMEVVVTSVAAEQSQSDIEKFLSNPTD